MLIFIPLAGSIAYFIVELLPELTSGGTFDPIKANLGRVVAPGRKIDELELTAKTSPTFENWGKLGDEYLAIKDFNNAIRAYQECLKGIFSNDLDTWIKMARAYEMAGEHQNVVDSVNKIREINPDYVKPEILILQAEAEWALGNISTAKELYEEISEGSNLDVKYQYACFLRKIDEPVLANQVFGTIMDTYTILPPNIKKKYRHLVRKIRENLKDF